MRLCVKDEGGALGSTDRELGDAAVSAGGRVDNATVRADHDVRAAGVVHPRAGHPLYAARTVEVHTRASSMWH